MQVPTHNPSLDRTGLKPQILSRRLEGCQPNHPFIDNDLALEWCEDRLRDEAFPARTADQQIGPSDYLLFKDFSPAEFEAVMSLSRARVFKRGQRIITAGDHAREVFFLKRGRVSVFLPGDQLYRLATFSPGMSFGEMAFLDGAPRSADIIADTDVECHLLTIEDFDRLGQSQPGIKIKLLERLCLDLTGKLRKANRELSVFE